MNNSVFKTLPFCLSSGVKTEFEYIWPYVFCLLEIWIVLCPFFTTFWYPPSFSYNNPVHILTSCFIYILNLPIITSLVLT